MSDHYNPDINDRSRRTPSEVRYMEAAQWCAKNGVRITRLDSGRVRVVYGQGKIGVGDSLHAAVAQIKPRSSVRHLFP